MRTKRVSLDDVRTLLVQQNFADDYQDSSPMYGDDTQAEGAIPAMTILRVAIERDLTDRQRDCVRMYFMEGKTMEQIGAELGVGKSTVCRHLQRARANLERAFDYAKALDGHTKIK